MTMRERMMNGKLFTDMCEGLPEERMKAKKLMKRFNDSKPDDIEGRKKLLSEIFGAHRMKALSATLHTAIVSKSSNNAKIPSASLGNRRDLYTMLNHQ